MYGYRWKKPVVCVFRSAAHLEAASRNALDHVHLYEADRFPYLVPYLTKIPREEGTQLVFGVVPADGGRQVAVAGHAHMPMFEAISMAGLMPALDAAVACWTALEKKAPTDAVDFRIAGSEIVVARVDVPEHEANILRLCVAFAESHGLTTVRMEDIADPGLRRRLVSGLSREWHFYGRECVCVCWSSEKIILDNIIKRADLII